MSSLKIAIAQLTSTEDFAKNVEQMERCLEQISAGSVDLVCFPENGLFFRVRKASSVKYITLAELAQSPLQKVVEEKGFQILLTTPLIENQQRVNATVRLKAGSNPQVLYRKMHLFDVDVPGAPPVRESDHFQHGEEPMVFEVRGWRIGLTICYDLRFAELFLHYAKVPVDAVLVPSAFLVPTGQAHWHVLLRARAIEGQFYVLAPAQVGEHREGDEARSTFGHSLAVDPWGRVLVDLESSPSVAVIELQRSEIEKVRAQIPMRSHRRLREK